MKSKHLKGPCDVKFMSSVFALPSECFIPQSKDLIFLQEAVNRELNMPFSKGYFGSTLGSLFFWRISHMTLLH